MYAEGFRSVVIDEQYFKDNRNFEKMLDPTKIDKQGRRVYIFIEVLFKNNRLLIPLRTNLGCAKRVFGIIGFSVPSKKKELAGLDYRYTLIINDDKYIKFQHQLNIPILQKEIIKKNYNQIETEIIEYVEGYIKVAKKSRERRDPKYRESALHNFHKELGISKKYNLDKTSIKEKEVAIGLVERISEASERAAEYNKAKENKIKVQARDER